MKGKTYVLLGAAAAFIVVGNLTPDTSYAMASEEDMNEGISVNIPEDKTDYHYDASIDSPAEFMAESHVIEEVENVAHFAGDSSTPLPEILMAEDHIIKDTEPNLSNMINKYGTPAAGTEMK